MKPFVHLVFVSAIVCASSAGCSSNPTNDPEGEGGASGGGSLSHAGSVTAVAGSSTTGAAGTPTSGGTASSGGGSDATTVGSTTLGGSPPLGGSAPLGGAGSPASAGGGENGGKSGENATGGSGPLPPYVASCSSQKYTPTSSPGAACVTTMAPEERLIASFEGEGVAPGWGVYPNVDGAIGFSPTTATPTVGGADDTEKALAFQVENLPRGIKIQVGFGTQCQDVRKLKGISFWAKGSIEGATQPFIVTANTLVVQLGSERSLLGGCKGAGCAAAPPDKRVSISADWREYRIAFDCFGDGKIFDGYFTNILINAFGPNASFAIDEIGYY